MQILVYKGIEFDDFALYRWANNSAECEYGYPSDRKLNLSEWEEVNAYICPHCIKKYGLYNESQSYEELVEKFISGECDNDEYLMTCGVKGCNNGKTFDSCWGARRCSLEEND